MGVRVGVANSFWTNTFQLTYFSSHRLRRLVGVRVREPNFFLDQSIGIKKTNTFQLKFFIKHTNYGHHRFDRFLGVKVGVASSRNKLALRTATDSKSEIPILYLL